MKRITECEERTKIEGGRIEAVLLSQGLDSRPCIGSRPLAPYPNNINDNT